MIFVTVGTQLPFDRLLRAMDTIARELGLDVLAQTYRTPEWSSVIRFVDALSPEEFDACFRQAEVVVSHAGIGSIISARRAQRPIILFPRKCELGEHRDDHQLATARQLCSAPGIRVAWSEGELRELLLNRRDLLGGAGLGPEYMRLIESLDELIHADR